MKKLYSIKLLLCALLLAIGCNAWGTDLIVTYDFSSRSNLPQGFPTTTGTSTTSEKNVTMSNGATFDIVAKDGYYSNNDGVKNSGKYVLFFGKNVNTKANSTDPVSSAYIKIPGKKDYKIKQVVMSCPSSNAGSVNVNIFDYNYNAMSTEQTTVNGTAKTFTFVLSNAAVNTPYYYTVSKGVSAGKNLQLYSMVVTYEQDNTPITPTIEKTDKTIFAGENLDVSTIFSSNSTGAFSYSVTKSPINAEYTLTGGDFLANTPGEYTIQANQAATTGFTSGTQTATITVNADVTYAISIVPSANGNLVIKKEGTSLADGTLLHAGDLLTIEATPNTGYKFRNWQYKAGDAAWTTRSTTFTYEMTAVATAFRANFDEIVYRTITWSVNGNTSVIEPSKIEDGANITFPTGLDDILGKKFMGWSANSAANAESDLVTGDVVASESTTFYAVYADVTPGTQEIAILTCTETTANSTYTKSTPKDDKNNTWNLYTNVVKQSINNVNHYYWGLNTNANGYNIESPTFSGKVVSIKAHAWNTSSSERGAILCSSDETKQPTTGDLGNLPISGGTKNVELTFTITAETQFNHFYIYVPGTTSAAIGFESIEVTYGSPDVYSNYTTTLSGIIDFRASDESGAYWATYSGAYNVVIPAEDENAVYNVYAVAYDNEALALVMLDFASDFINVDAQSNPIVPANVGVLVKAVAKSEKTVSALTYTVSATAGENYDAEYNSLRAASVEKEASGYKFYMLARDANGENIGFYYGAADGGVFTSREGSAYLAVPTSALAPARFIFGQRGVPTDLLNVNDNPSTDSGQALSTKVLRDGRLYIVRDGKTYDSFGRLVK